MQTIVVQTESLEVAGSEHSSRITGSPAESAPEFNVLRCFAANRIAQ
jgi:hypothetical protein